MLHCQEKEQTFRFSSRKVYEAELTRVLTRMEGKKREDVYEELLEEYMLFCETFENA